MIGVDVDRSKLEFIQAGKSPIVEDRIDDLIAQAVQQGLLTVTDDIKLAVQQTDLSLVCVGTPSAPSGELSTTYLENVTNQIAAVLSTKSSWHTVVYRSTMVPGTCETLLIPILERLSQKQIAQDFGVCVNPEYLREGTSVSDFFDPPKTVIGATDDRAQQIALSLYSDLPGHKYTVPIRIAEMTKYIDNTFHALKVCFANEIGAICNSLDIDSHSLVDIFLSDTKLNISKAYLTPGFAFGGSCLPKDVRALTHMAARHSVSTPLIDSLIHSNEVHIRRALELVLASGCHTVTLFGLSFKTGTDDLRESPFVELAERLVGKGYHLRIHDTNVSCSRLIGSNAAYVDRHLPHLADLLIEDMDAALHHGELLILATKSPAVHQLLTRRSPSQILLDLVRLPSAETLRGQPTYKSISW